MLLYTIMEGFPSDHFDWREVYDAERMVMTELFELAKQRALSAEYISDVFGEVLCLAKDEISRTVVNEDGSEDTQVTLIQRAIRDTETFDIMVGKLMPDGDLDVTKETRGVSVSREQKLDSEAAQEAIDLSKRIVDGEIAGTYTTTSLKAIDTSEESNSLVMVIAVEQTTAPGALMPVTSVRLTFARYYNDDQGHIAQVRTIVSDPNTGNMRMIDNLQGEGWSAMGQQTDNDNGFCAPGFVMTPNPLPEITAASLQEQYQLVMPLDRSLTEQEWKKLLTEPLDEESNAIPL